jgi:hypothetical protein
MQDLCVQPVSVRTGGAFGTRPPLRSVHICRDAFPGPECVPDRPEPVMCIWDEKRVFTFTGSEVWSCAWSNQRAARVEKAVTARARGCRRTKEIYGEISL